MMIVSPSSLKSRKQRLTYYLESIKEAAAKAVYGLVKYYTGNNTGDTPGNLPDPYNCNFIATINK
jgi:hypothetical protein